ncbi:MAG: tRNA (adenosine(37)-N6)-threonylcarbamoyltransferase complex dimerization subunit type 1 TsaB [Polyangiaceae bacterium]|nr:tRNA (adenosine(37)-N6)-threonylcarbamoyltransferase complex dimerization subunit type 1 TsaB [Polyangiaceae bacterium]
MRVLAFETSSRRGTVAAVEDGRVIASRSHDAIDQHAERLPGLLEGVLAEAGWKRGAIDRVAAGRGPGSFTGLRIGLALAQGIALGLGVPCVGVGSLRAMAAAVPAGVGGARVCCTDARRGELFVAVYDALGAVRWPAAALPVGEARAWIARALGAEPVVLVGEAAALLERDAAPPLGWFQDERADLPHAAVVGQLAERLEPGEHPAEPEYVREADARRPELRVLVPALGDG